MSKLIDINVLNKNNNHIKNLINNEIIERSSMIYKNVNDIVIQGINGGTSPIDQFTQYIRLTNKLDKNNKYNNYLTLYNNIETTGIAGGILLESIGNKDIIEIHCCGQININGEEGILIESLMSNITLSCDNNININANDLYINTKSSISIEADSDITINTDDAFYLNTKSTVWIDTGDEVIGFRTYDSTNSNKEYQRIELGYDGSDMQLTSYSGDIKMYTEDNDIDIYANTGSVYISSGSENIQIVGEYNINMTCTNTVNVNSSDINIKINNMQSSVTLKQYIQGVMNGTY